MTRIIWIVLLAVSLCTGAPKKTLTLLIKMIPSQEAWFQKNIIRPFIKQSARDGAPVTVDVQHFNDFRILEKMLMENPGIDVIKVPMDRAGAFLEKGYITPVSAVAGPDLTETIRADYLLTVLAATRDTVYYIPRKYETRIMVYRPSKVEEAVAKYPDLVAPLDSALKALGGAGMPEGYTLEADPNQWDYFDVLMAGYVWTVSEKGGRIAHRGKNYEGTFLRVADRAYQLGATRGEIPLLASTPVRRAFEWEFMYTRLGVYNPRMFWKKWVGQDLWEAFGSGQIHLSFFTQLDCFFLRGTGEDGLRGTLREPFDLGFAVMPLAAPLSGQAALMANRNTTTNGWFWGVGRRAANKDLALKFMLFATSKKNQKAEFNAFGVVPTRKALLEENKDRLYLKKWRNRVLQTSIEQIRLNRNTVMPALPDMDVLQEKYFSVLSTICEDTRRVKTLADVPGVINRVQAEGGR